MMYMHTYTGKQWDHINPQPENVCIEDIAHALSMICRYAGHCQHFYSVAEHSYHVSYMVPPEHAMQGLLHDATEAYCVDIPRPLKQYLLDYKVIEQHTRVAICDKFNLAHDEPTEVKQADNDILLNESTLLFKYPPSEWIVKNARNRKVKLNLFAPDMAEAAFLARYKELNGQQ